MVEDIVPVIIKNSVKILGMCWTSDKAAQKTLEQENLWYVHPQTTRVIEATPNIIIDKVVKKKGWYEFDVVSTQSYSETQLASISSLAGFPMQTVPTKNSSSSEQENAEALVVEAASSTNEYAILGKLQSIIQARKNLMPEGSYTSHLFSSGKEKIRKKVGEEAIETILSTTPDSIISESADLLFHLWVMFIHEQIAPQDVMRELERRHINVQ